jgi:predicted deacylase
VSCALLNVVCCNGLCNFLVMMASSCLTLLAAGSHIGERESRVAIGNVGRALSAANGPRGAVRVVAIRHAPALIAASDRCQARRHG